MTNSSNDRLDRLEALQQRTQQQIDSNSLAIAANSTAIAEVRNTLSEAVGRTLRGIELLREAQEEDRVNVQERLERMDTSIAGINATLAILQQMLRDQNGNGNQPPQA